MTLDDKPIKCVSSLSYLGVTLDNKLSWSPHIKLIVSIFNAKIAKLKQMKTFDRSTLESITYYISLWGFLRVIFQARGPDSHIRAARLIYNLIPSIPKHEVFSKAKWNPICIIKDLLALLISLTINLTTDSKLRTCFQNTDQLQFKRQPKTKSKALHDSSFSLRAVALSGTVYQPS